MYGRFSYTPYPVHPGLSCLLVRTSSTWPWSDPGLIPCHVHVRPSIRHETNSTKPVLQFLIATAQNGKIPFHCVLSIPSFSFYQILNWFIMIFYIQPVYYWTSDMHDCFIIVSNMKTLQWHKFCLFSGGWGGSIHFNCFYKDKHRNFMNIYNCMYKV